MQQNISDKDGNSFHLPDGRRLGFAEYGVASGIPILFFHGAPGSSYLHTDMAQIVAQRGVRLIAVDRPGYGLSDPHPGRTFLSWADDMEALTDKLGIARFSIIGLSGGCPHALACAYKLSDRVSKVALAAALVPGVTDGIPAMVSGLYTLAQANPDELRKTFAALAPSAAALLAVVSASVADWDKKIVSERAAELELDYTRTLLSGSEGIASDYILFSGSWGFSLHGINTEILLWSGTADQNTPLSMVRSLASQLPNSKIFMLPDEGHFALYGHWDEILEQMV